MFVKIIFVIQCLYYVVIPETAHSFGRLQRCGYLSGARCRLAHAQLMPLPLTVCCFSKVQIGFTFLVPAHPGSPDKGMCCPEYVYFYLRLTLYHCLWVIKRSLQSVWTTEAPISIKVWKTRQITTGCNFNSRIRTDYDYRKFSDESDSKSFENQSTFGEVMDKSRPRPMCTILWFTVLV